MGIIVGSKVHGVMHEYAFLVPAVVVGILGMAYLVHRVFILKQRLFSDTEMELVDISVHAVLEEDAFAQQSSAEEGERSYSADAKRRMYTGRGRSFSARSSREGVGGGSFMKVVSEERLRQSAGGGCAVPGDWVSVTRRCALQRQDSLRQSAHSLAPDNSPKKLVEQLQTVPE